VEHLIIIPVVIPTNVHSLDERALYAARSSKGDNIIFAVGMAVVLAGDFLPPLTIRQRLGE
jgi:hypothetical protein